MLTTGTVSGKSLAYLVPIVDHALRFVRRPCVCTRLIAVLYASLCSFVFDYVARQKIGGTHLTYSYLNQLPVLPPATYESEAPWSRGASLRDWISDRVLEVTYTAWDLARPARRRSQCRSRARQEKRK